MCACVVGVCVWGGRVRSQKNRDKGFEIMSKLPHDEELALDDVLTTFSIYIIYVHGYAVHDTIGLQAPISIRTSMGHQIEHATRRV